MVNQVDFEIVGRDGRMVALVDVKNVPHLTAQTAVEFKRDLLADGPKSTSLSYFLLISQDQAYLWSPREASREDAPPAATIPMRQVLREYLTDQLLDQHLRGAELEIAVFQWLSDLTRGCGRVASPNASVAEFVEKLRGGEIYGGQGA